MNALDDFLNRRKHRPAVLLAAWFIVVVIALVDWWVRPYISIGFLYLIPVLMVSVTLLRTQIVLVGLVCAVLQETLNFPENERVIRLVFTSIGFVVTGIFVSELLRNRDRVLKLAEELQRSIQLRQDAEAQLQLLVDTSPAAIVTINAKGEILIANEAAQQLFAVQDTSLDGQLISPYLPALQSAVENQRDQVFRTSLQCRGQRSNGESFLAGVWFSTYTTATGPMLTAIVADLSDDLVAGRTSSLDYTLVNTRILMSGMAHEVRNICSAMRVIYKNLHRQPEMARSEDFRAMDSLIQSLDNLSTEEIRRPDSDRVSAVRLTEVLDELRVLVDNAYSESGISVTWNLADSLPLIRADRFGLVQVFLNLVSNSKRAMASSAKKELNVAASCETDAVVIRFADTGTGIDSPDRLFRPFRPGTGTTGLGLYVSRSIMRSFGGDLVCEPRSGGACFAVVLPTPPGAENGVHA
jgi:signal transduction histidine kinase